MRAWLVWGIGVAVYLVTICHRTSLGVASPQATVRFDTSASVIALFVVLQVGMYAGMQLPSGMLLDRFGSRKMLTTGALVMATGQLLMAIADTLPLAVVARMLTGTGDAACFISALRLIPAWFPGHRIPVLTQVTGVIGQSGQILSAVPFVWLLHRWGWTPSFLTLAGLGLVMGLLALTVVRDSPTGPLRRDSHVAERFVSQIAATFREPGNRMGMFVHATACFGALAFGLMWGFPYLVEAEGRSPATAGGLFTLFVLGSVVAGPIIGHLTRQHPLRRTTLTMLVSLTGIVPWLVIFVWPGPAPLWLLIALVTGLAISGPASLIGLDQVRTFNPQNRLGTASGMVVMFGFAMALVTILLIGIVLDLAAEGSTPGLGDYRTAMAVQIPLWIGCYVGLIVSRRQALRLHGVTLRPWKEVWRDRRSTRR
ncbi:MFS transporter [Granulicoccus sp. GXG6511]|uniref:MFS transporter n=1 Tax=Granulicoccus sp. GXG6511 TaxID=3381351 RepID=UPI003D7D1E22